MRPHRSFAAVVALILISAACAPACSSAAGPSPASSSATMLTAVTAALADVREARDLELPIYLLGLQPFGPGIIIEGGGPTSSPAAVQAEIVAQFATVITHLEARQHLLSMGSTWTGWIAPMLVKLEKLIAICIEAMPDSVNPQYTPIVYDLGGQAVRDLFHARDLVAGLQ